MTPPGRMVCLVVSRVEPETVARQEAEERKVLLALTAGVRAEEDAIAQTQEALVELDLLAAVRWIPETERGAEAKPLSEQLQKLRAGRRGGGPVLLGEILPLVLEKLGVGGVQSVKSEEPSPG